MEKKEIKITVMLEEEARTQYKKHCENNGYSLSKRIRLLMEKDKQGKIIIKD